MGFGGPVIKEGLILVISIVTLQNYFGDLGEVCGKYPGWVKVPGPFDICHFFTLLCVGYTNKIWVDHPGWVKVPGLSDF